MILDTELVALHYVREIPSWRCCPRHLELNRYLSSKALQCESVLTTGRGLLSREHQEPSAEASRHGGIRRCCCVMRSSLSRITKSVCHEHWTHHVHLTSCNRRRIVCTTVPELGSLSIKRRTPLTSRTRIPCTPSPFFLVVSAIDPFAIFARLGLRSRQVDLDDEDYGRRQALNASNHQPTRPVDKERAEADLALSIKKATSPEESAPSKQSEPHSVVDVLIMWHGK